MAPVMCSKRMAECTKLMHERDVFQAENARMRATLELVAPAVAVLSRTEEVAPSIRAILAEVERMLLADLAPGARKKSPAI